MAETTWKCASTYIGSWFGSGVRGKVAILLFCCLYCRAQPALANDLLLDLNLRKLPEGVTLLYKSGIQDSSGDILENDSISNAAISADSEVITIRKSDVSAALIPILEIGRPPVTETVYAIQGLVRYEGVVGTGYLELISEFAEGEEYFTRTLSDAGPMQFLQGGSEWREFKLPFHLVAEGSGQLAKPSELRLGVYLPGKGQLSLKDLKLIQYSTGFAAPASEAVNWWGEEEGGMVAGIVGAVLGCFGAALGVLLSLDRGVKFAAHSFKGFIILGMISVVGGVIAVIFAQPHHVYYPLLLLGLLLCLVGGFNYRLAAKRANELRLSNVS